MKELRIEIEIDEDGRVTADADGFEGDACLDALDALLDGLATDAAAVERKPDRPGHTTRRGRAAVRVNRGGGEQ